MSSRTLLPALALLPLALACNESTFKGRSGKEKGAMPTLTKEFTQDTYPAATTTATQGKAGAPEVDTFDQGQWGMLDILVVIDDSGSMAEEQANLSTKLNPLLSSVSKADWQISVVTTDPTEGCQRALIKKSDPNAATAFQNAVKAGTSGTGVERPFLTAVNALKCNASFPRQGSTLVTLIVTDEDNCHIDQNQGYGCFGAADLQPDYLHDYLASIRKLGQDAKVYGLYWEPGTTQSACPTALKTADKVASLVESTGGKAGSICDADYTPTLQAISNDVAQILKYEFEMKDDPDQGTLEVKVNGAAWTKFTVEGRKVKFTEPPPFGSKVEVLYKHGAEGELATAFPLDKTPVAGSFKVSVNGTEVGADAYHWNPDAKKLEFAEAPAEKAQIKIDYKELKPLKDAFDLGDQNVDPKSVEVSVNGEALKADAVKLDAKTGVVTLAPAPAEGAKIVVTYKDKEPA